MKNFEQWLIDTLAEPAPDWVNFDPDGNSPRAVVMRMRKSVFSALKYEFIPLWKDIVYEIKSFDGFNTSLGWFVQILLLPILIFIAPFIRTTQGIKMLCVNINNLMQSMSQKRCEKIMGNIKQYL